jgi:ADP-glucose pyrophosphorylase
VERAVVMRGATVGAGCTLRGCIVGPGASLPEGALLF